MESERSVRQELEMKKQVWIHRMKSHMAAVLAGLLTACVLCILVPAGHVFAYTDVEKRVAHHLHERWSGF